jgi:hypothetical protein
MAVLEINGEHVERSPLDRLTNTWPSPGDLSYTVALFWRGPSCLPGSVRGWVLEVWKRERSPDRIVAVPGIR